MYIIRFIILSLVYYSNCQAQELIPFRDKNLWGYRDKKTGKIEIAPQYQYGLPFKFEMAVVGMNEKLGAIDVQNNMLIPIEHDYLQVLDSSDFLFGSKRKNFGEYSIGVISRSGKVKIPAIYSRIDKQRNYYLVAKSLESVIGQAYGEDVRSVKYSYGLYNRNGGVLIPCQYEYLSWRNDTLLVASTEKHQALFNSRGNQLTKFEFITIGEFLEGVAKVKRGNKFGFIYPSGETAISINFDYCSDFEKGYAYIKQKSLWGLINKKGVIVIKPEYSFEDLKLIAKREYGR